MTHPPALTAALASGAEQRHAWAWAWAEIARQLDGTAHDCRTARQRRVAALAPAILADLRRLVPRKALAHRYGVHPHTVDRIANRGGIRVWGHTRRAPGGVDREVTP